MKDKIKEIMAAVFKTDVINISDDIKQHDFQIWDSLRHLNLIVEIEEQFGISIEPEELTEMTSLDNILVIVEGKLQAK